MPVSFLRLFSCLCGVITAGHAADTVVLLHGLGRGPLSMARLARDLKSDGYEVRNVSYPSRHGDIRTLADDTLRPLFNEADASGARIHIVTHSLGGILVRQYLHDHGAPDSLARVVMLAPPNAGSELVDTLRRWAIYRRLNGPAGLQLGTDPDSTPLTLGPLPDNIEVGVIAGHASLNPLFSSLIDGPDDGKVSVARTHVGGETDHLTVPYSHTWLMWRRPVLIAVRTFLRSRHFPAAPAANLSS